MSYQQQLHSTSAKVIAILLCVANVSFADEEQEDEASAAVVHVANIIYAPVAEDAEWQLSTKGLAKPEIDEAADSIAVGIADCIVSSLQKANNDEANYAIELIANGTAKEDINVYFDSLRVEGSDNPLAVFETESDACIQSVEASYGLSDY